MFVYDIRTVVQQMSLSMCVSLLSSSSADYGEEKCLALANKNSEQVMEALESLVKEGEK